MQNGVRWTALLATLALTACQTVGGNIAGVDTTARSSVAALTGAQQFSAARNCKHVGVLLPDIINSSRWELRDRPQLEAAIRNELPDARIETLNAQGDAEQQQSQAQQMLKNGVCILVVAPQDSVRATTIVQLAAERGVPVIAYDRLIADDRVAFHVTVDYERTGELQGEWIASHAPKGSRIAMFHGPDNDLSGKLLHDGVMKKLGPLFERGDLVLAYELNTPNWSIKNVSTSATQMFDQAGLYNDVSVVYVANDDMANGVIGALQRIGRAGKVLVVGQDATADGMRNVVSGLQGMTVYRNPAQQARNTARLVGALSRGEDPAALLNFTSNLDSGAQIRSIQEQPVAINKDNVKSSLIDTGLVSLAEVCNTGITVQIDWCQ